MRQAGCHVRPLLADAIAHHAQHEPSRPALILEDRVTSYEELNERAARVANGLLATGLKAQSRAAILSGNIDCFFELWHGASLCGAVLAPLNARLMPSELAYIVDDSQAEILFVDGPFHELTTSILDDLPTVRTVISLSGGHPDWPSYQEWRHEHSPELPPQQVSADHTVVQMYTSGTTGFPKGVELSHTSVLLCARAMMGLRPFEPGEAALVTAPLFHTAGSAWAQSTLQSGGTCILFREPSPTALLKAIETHRASNALFVPAVIQMLLQAPECSTTDFSSLERILYGASPIPVERLREAVERFGCDFEQGYGLTETVGPVAMLRPEDHRRGDKLQSCGKAVPGTKIRVVDEAGKDCETGTVGEIVVAGPQVMKGYWRRDEDTAATIRDGWLHTGDAGYFDEDGYLFIYDRLKDMIVSGSENVYPVEVENALAACPGVADVAVIGIPDEKWGEAVKAVVVPKNGVTLSEEEIIGFARQRIAAFKCPKSVDLVDSIPRNPSGKILKRELRERYWEGYERRVY